MNHNNMTRSERYCKVSRSAGMGLMGYIRKSWGSERMRRRKRRSSRRRQRRMRRRKSRESEREEKKEEAAVAIKH